MKNRITQLEDHLFADQNGAYRAQLAAKLESEKKRLKACLRQPCTSAHYTVYTRQLKAIEYAQTIIDVIWCVYHGPLVSTTSNCLV